MPAHFIDACLNALPFNRAVQVLPDHFNPLSYAGRGKVFSCSYKMLDLVKYPGITDGCPSDHYTVNAIFIFIQKGLFGRINITIAKYGNLYPGIFFYPGNMG